VAKQLDLWDFLTVTLNPTLDVSTSVERLIDHEKLRCQSEQEQVGGGGINVSHVIHCLGGTGKALFPSGGWRGQQITGRLTEAGIDCLPVPISGENRQCFTVYELQTGHEYRFILPGPTLQASEWHAMLDVLDTHLPSQFLIASGSLPPGMPTDFYAQMASRARKHRPNLKVVIDTSGQALAQAIEAGVFMIKPSLEEFVELTGIERQDDSSCISACRSLIDQGKCQVIALTLGAKGSIIVTATEALRVEPLPVKVTSTVGAGDSFVGGFLWSLTQSPDLRRAASVGTAAASAALQTQGQLSFDRDVILKDSERVRIESLD
jgi:6-phosphofructokinase 2